MLAGADPVADDLREPDIGVRAGGDLQRVADRPPLGADGGGVRRLRGRGRVRGGAVSGGVDSGRVAVDLHGCCGAHAATGPPVAGWRGGARDRRCDGEPRPDRCRGAGADRVGLVARQLCRQPPQIHRRAGSEEPAAGAGPLRAGRPGSDRRAVADRPRAARRGDPHDERGGSSRRHWSDGRRQRSSRCRQALATIETTTRSALVEMRRMLGILRGSDSRPGTLAPAPACETSMRWWPTSCGRV